MRSISAVLVASALLVAGACAEGPTTRPQPGTPALSSSIGATLVECPTSVSSSASALVTPLGGGVATAGGSSISVPAGAVLVPTTITITVPASNYMEVDITADGAPHYTFQKPVTVSIDYSRCSRANIEKSSLTAWYIDSATKALLERMQSSDDKLARRVSFSTGHLSGYAVAD